MKLVKVAIELIIDDDTDFLLDGETLNGMFTPRYNHNKIASYLNKKLGLVGPLGKVLGPRGLMPSPRAPEFFGEFGPENIIEVKELDD